MNSKHSKVQYNTLIVVLITSFITTFSGSAMNLSIPSIEADFHVSAQTVGWVITIYTLTCATLAVPFGKIADNTNRKKILWLGILIFTIASFSCLISWEMWVLLCFRFLQGVGAAMIFSTNMAVLIGAFDSKERGRVLGYSTCATYIGLSAGPVLGGLLNSWLGWKSILVASGIVALIAFCFAITKLPKEPSDVSVGEPLDKKGSILFIVSVVSIMYGISTLNSGYFAIALVVFGIIVGIAFVKSQLKSKHPVIKMELFRDNKGFAYSNLASLLNYGATFAITYLMSIYLQVVMGYSSQIAGIILITAPVVQAIGSPIAGKLSDKHSPFVLSSAGMGVCAVALGAFIFIDLDTSIYYIVGMLIVVGVGFALFASPNTNAIMGAVGKEDLSIASSILSTMRSIGHTSSMAIVTLIVGLHMGNQALNQAEPETIVSTMHTCFIVFCIICIIGIFVSLQRKK